MTQITLRGIDPEIERKIRRMAKESGKSLNRVVLDIIDQHAEFNKKDKGENSLKKLAGGWSEEDAQTFLEAIRSCEQIDEEMWK